MMKDITIALLMFAVFVCYVQYDEVKTKYKELLIEHSELLDENIELLKNEK